MSALALVTPAEAGAGPDPLQPGPAAVDTGLDPLLRTQRVWRATAAPRPVVDVPRRSTGWAALDAVLPAGGWPDAALVEVLMAHDGLGELTLLLPMLAAVATPLRPVLLVAPPYRPYAPAWQRAGVALAGLQVLDAAPRDALWAMEQALRAGSCAAVLGWPLTADDKALRRLQVAAETGQCLGIAFRPARMACNPSPAPLRLQVEAGEPRRGSRAAEPGSPALDAPDESRIACRGSDVGRDAFYMCGSDVGRDAFRVSDASRAFDFRSSGASRDAFDACGSRASRDAFDACGSRASRDAFAKFPPVTRADFDLHIRVLKCRGAQPPTRPLRLPAQAWR